MSNHSNTKTACSSNNALKVLFIASGNHGAISPVVGNQAEALMSEGVEIEWYLLRGKGIKGYLKNVKPLRQYLKAHQYDAIHAHYSLSAFVASLAGAKPLVVSLMGSDVKAAGWYKFIIRLFAALGGWKSIIVKSNDMYRSLVIRRAIIIPNGVNLDRFKPMDKTECQRRLGWNIEENKENRIENTENNLTKKDESAVTCSNFNSLDPQSAQKQAFGQPDAQSCSDALTDSSSKKDQKRSKKIHILFPANASRPEKDFALAKEAVALLQSDFRLKIEDLRFDGVELHAFENTPNEETPYWYNAADVVLMTSKWEGSPNAIKEALACSRPIVVTKIGDVVERTEGVEGCYVAQSREPQELDSLIEKALAYNVTKGRERIIADGLDSHVINRRLIELYRK